MVSHIWSKNSLHAFLQDVVCRCTPQSSLLTRCLSIQDLLGRSVPCLLPPTNACCSYKGMPERSFQPCWYLVYPNTTLWERTLSAVGSRGNVDQQRFPWGNLRMHWYQSDTVSDSGGPYKYLIDSLLASTSLVGEVVSFATSAPDSATDAVVLKLQCCLFLDPIIVFAIDVISVNGVVAPL